jgi:hypothetical protein
MAGRLSSSSKAVISSPVDPEDLGRLIAHALHCESERVTPLAQLVADSLGRIGKASKATRS